MTGEDQIKAILVELRDFAPAGYAIALHIHFTTPTFLFQSYKKDWLDYYSQNGLVMSDPTVLWAFENTGTASWDSLKDMDTGNVLQKARDFGLAHGVTCAVEANGSRSIAGFARADGPFSDDETAHVLAKLEQLHDLTNNVQTIAPATAQALRHLAIRVTHPEPT